MDSRMGIFITMNPGYAGRTELPESVKALFRPVVCIVPDLQQICEIMLFSEGFLLAKVMSNIRTFKNFVWCTLYRLDHIIGFLERKATWPYSPKIMFIARYTWKLLIVVLETCHVCKCCFLVFYSQVLAKKMTVLYKLAAGQLSKQSHYDFGLRALKSVLVMAGELKRGSPDLHEVCICLLVGDDGDGTYDSTVRLMETMVV